MNDILDYLRLIRYEQARLAVQYNLWQLDRVKRELAKAYAAADRAQAALRIHELPLRDSEPPAAFVLAKRTGATL